MRLRPGYGLAVDDWRVAETWKTVQGKLAHAAATSRTESLILWRRIAGGLSQGQQRALAEPLLATVRTLHKRQTSGTGKGDRSDLQPARNAGSAAAAWVAWNFWRSRSRSSWAECCSSLLPKKKLESIRPAIAWAIGRLGAASRPMDR